MQKRTSMIILASVIGTVLLLAGLYIIFTMIDEQTKLLNQLYPTGDNNGSPAGVGWGMMVFLVFVISSLFTGIFVNILINKSLIAVSLKKSMINAALYSILSGLLSGIFVWISYGILTVLYGDPTEILRTPLFFIIIAVLIAVISMFGGVCFSIINFEFRGSKPV
jgi:hypothetical protein